MPAKAALGPANLVLWSDESLSRARWPADPDASAPESDLRVPALPSGGELLSTAEPAYPWIIAVALEEQSPGDVAGSNRRLLGGDAAAKAWKRRHASAGRSLRRQSGLPRRLHRARVLRRCVLYRYPEGAWHGCRAQGRTELLVHGQGNLDCARPRWGSSVAAWSRSRRSSDAVMSLIAGSVLAASTTCVPSNSAFTSKDYSEGRLNVDSHIPRVSSVHAGPHNANRAAGGWQRTTHLRAHAQELSRKMAACPGPRRHRRCPQKMTTRRNGDSGTPGIMSRKSFRLFASAHADRHQYLRATGQHYSAPCALRLEPAPPACIVCGVLLLNHLSASASSSSTRHGRLNSLVRASLCARGQPHLIFWQLGKRAHTPVPQGARCMMRSACHTMRSGNLCALPFSHPHHQEPPTDRSRGLFHCGIAPRRRVRPQSKMLAASAPSTSAVSRGRGQHRIELVQQVVQHLHRCPRSRVPCPACTPNMGADQDNLCVLRDCKTRPFRRSQPIRIVCARPSWISQQTKSQ